MAGRGSAESLAGVFAHLGSFGELQRFLFRHPEDGSRQRMLGVTLQTCHERQHLSPRKTSGQELLRQSWLAISERPGFVENRGPTSGDLLKHDRTFDDNRPSCAEGNRADDWWHHLQRPIATSTPIAFGAVATSRRSTNARTHVRLGARSPAGWVVFSGG
jgi:hypothetical protein